MADATPASDFVRLLARATQRDGEPAALAAIPLERVESNGYAFQIEMSFRAWKKGFKLGEIPIMFVDRDVGESKMSKAIVREADRDAFVVFHSLSGAEGGVLTRRGLH